MDLLTFALFLGVELNANAWNNYMYGYGNEWNSDASEIILDFMFGIEL